jgi:hypothetical protein
LVTIDGARLHKLIAPAPHTNLLFEPALNMRTHSAFMLFSLGCSAGS